MHVINLQNKKSEVRILENKRKVRRIELKEKREMKRKQKEMLLLKKKKRQKTLGFTLCGLCLVGILSFTLLKHDTVVEAEVSTLVDVTKLSEPPGVSVIEEEIAKRQAEVFQQLRKELKEKAEAERQEAERQEAERIEAERIEAERQEAERIEAERIEAERQEAERQEAERQEAERIEAERIEAERIEAERQEAERQQTIQVQTEVQTEVQSQPEIQPQPAVQQRTDGFNYNGYHFDTPIFWGSGSVPQWTQNIYIWGDATTGFGGYSIPGRHYLVEKYSEAGETIRQLGIGSQVVIDGQTLTVRGVQSGVAIDNVDFAINLWNQGYTTWQSCDTNNYNSPQTIWWAS